MKNQLLGGLYGLLIGDAVGVPYEFNKPGELPPFDKIDMPHPADFSKTYPQVPVGTWSDDGSLSLCLLETLLTNTYFDPRLMFDKMVAWRNDGYLAVDGKKFDIGIQTADALEEYIVSGNPYPVGQAKEWANGNGSLMRSLPMALVHYKRGTCENYCVTCSQSHLTHPHPRSKFACALYVQTAVGLLNGMGKSQAIDWAIAETASHLTHADEYELAQFKLVVEGEHVEYKGSGYVVDSLWSSYHAFLMGNSFEDVVRRAIALGNDTDTTACIAGGLAGIFYGYDGIPARWLSQLRGREIVDPIALRLLQHHGLEF